METLHLKLSLAGLDTPEDKLRELQSWLQDAGIFAKLEIEPPAEEEMGGKIKELVLIFSLLNEQVAHLPPSVEEGLREIEKWQQQLPPQQQQVLRPVISLTGHGKHDDDIQEVLEREQWHIEVRRPKVVTTKEEPKKR